MAPAATAGQHAAAGGAPAGSLGAVRPEPSSPQTPTASGPASPQAGSRNEPHLAAGSARTGAPSAAQPGPSSSGAPSPAGDTTRTGDPTVRHGHGPTADFHPGEAAAAGGQRNEPHPATGSARTGAPSAAQSGPSSSGSPGPAAPHPTAATVRAGDPAAGGQRNEPHPATGSARTGAPSAAPSASSSSGASGPAGDTARTGDPAMRHGHGPTAGSRLGEAAAAGGQRNEPHPATGSVRTGAPSAAQPTLASPQASTRDEPHLAAGSARTGAPSAAQPGPSSSGAPSPAGDTTRTGDPTVRHGHGPTADFHPGEAAAAGGQPNEPHLVAGSARTGAPSAAQSGPSSSGASDPASPEAGAGRESGPAAGTARTGDPAVRHGHGPTGSRTGEAAVTAGQSNEPHPATRSARTSAPTAAHRAPSSAGASGPAAPQGGGAAADARPAAQRDAGPAPDSSSVDFGWIAGMRVKALTLPTAADAETAGATTRTPTTARRQKVIAGETTGSIPVHLLFRDEPDAGGGAKADDGGPATVPVGKVAGDGAGAPIPAPTRPAPPTPVTPSSSRPAPTADPKLVERPGPVLPGWVGVVGGVAALLGCAAMVWWTGAVPAEAARMLRLPTRPYDGIHLGQWALLALGVVVALFFLGGLGRGRVGYALVLTLFGEYRGTVRRTGLLWVSPLLLRRRVDVRLRHWRSEPLPAVDAKGTALDVVVLVVWRIRDTVRAALGVDRHEEYLREQVEAAMARVLSQLPADAFHEDAPTLRDAETVGEALTRMLSAECAPVGIDVFSAQPTRIEYAPEVAAAMRRRRIAAIDAKHRDSVLTSVVDAVDDVVHRLTSRGLVELDDYEKKALVKDLTVAFYTGRTAPGEGA
ncbi:SPFH domain-containing protein [Streptomyces sp. NPDC046275]|uniref:SPFH domain-containing protein n=1 Tax=Streptomyces sp. NPDC046275 TaxID=3157201 RepID=UPI0033E11CD4